VKETLTLFYGNICYSFSGISLHSRRAGPRTLRLKNRGNPSLPGTVGEINQLPNPKDVQAHNNTPYHERNVPTIKDVDGSPKET
jgi:hypothetical protein